MENSIADSLAGVTARIRTAAERCGRDAGEIKLIAVSKTHPASAIGEAITAGTRVFGENKVQEAEEKIVEVGRDHAEWHLIGHLQSNKARKAVRLFDVIHTVDSIDIAERLERICEEEGRERLSVLVQVDLADESSKAGIERAKAADLAKFLSKCRRLTFDGLMTIPPYFDDAESARPFFRELRELRDELSACGSFSGEKPGELSMGMSHDMEVAIEEGATMVRVGTAIFGERTYGRG